jgi:putative ATPase
MKELDYGKEYMYSHDFPGNFVQQDFLPEEIKGTQFYNAGSSKKEQEIETIINHLWGDKYTKK